MPAVEQWNDPAFARAWAAANQDNPARAEYLDLLIGMVRAHLDAWPVPRRVLDLGCGSGTIAARVLEEIAGTSVVGVDGSPPMLELAREHLARFGNRIQLAHADFETATPDDVPGGPFGAAIAVQSIHNSTDEGKRRALASARAAMAPGGIFVLLDRIRLVTPTLFAAYRSLWDQIGARYHGQDHEGETFAEHERSVAERGDKPGSLEQNLLWLREAGFAEVAAVHVVGVRAVIVAVALA